MVSKALIVLHVLLVFKEHYVIHVLLEFSLIVMYQFLAQKTVQIMEIVILEPVYFPFLSHLSLLFLKINKNKKENVVAWMDLLIVAVILVL